MTIFANIIYIGISLPNKISICPKWASFGVLLHPKIIQSKKSQIDLPYFFFSIDTWKEITLIKAGQP
jgi:hypothetical protein